MLDFTIRTKEDLKAAVRTYGILPLFENSIEGFSVEEHTAPEAWFSDEPGVWEWKGPVIRETGCAYGKFFERKAAFVSAEWFPDLANWRRDGYDYDARYDDELVSFREKQFYDLLDAHAPVLSKDLKRLGDYRKGGRKGFDTLIMRLQEQCYAVIGDFRYMTDKYGREYGWGVAVYTTPEKQFGERFRDEVYIRSPEESRARLLAQLARLCPEADTGLLDRFLR